MTRHERLSAILGIVVEEGSIHIDDIITRLNVSAATARLVYGYSHTYQRRAQQHWQHRRARQRRRQERHRHQH